MARPPFAVDITDINDPNAPIDQEKFTGAMLQMREHGAQVTALAVQMGYQGSITAADLEDGIRFYQRRSVEALLECGKRLLLLKEITPHGEFMQRVEMLGFTERTARRFMQAAVKTSKSANLAVLATQVKSASAFLELVTHDDDADIERLTDLDDIDRMSVSQVRAALRDARAERQATDKLMESKNKTIDRLKLGLKRVESLPADDALALLKKESSGIAANIDGLLLGELRQALVALHNYEGHDNSPCMSSLVAQVQARLNSLRQEFNLIDTSTAEQSAFADKVAQWDIR